MAVDAEREAKVSQFPIMVDRVTSAMRNPKAFWRDYGFTARLHGNGFIQVDAGPGLRLHVWSNELPCQRVSTQIHDHRFSFISRILLGEIINVEYDPVSWSEDYSEPLYNLYSVRSNVSSENTDLVRVPGRPVRMYAKAAEVVEPGQEYEFEARLFHETQFRGLTATVMLKTANFPKHIPSVAVPLNQEPDNDFHRDDPAFKLVMQALVAQVCYEVGE